MSEQAQAGTAPTDAGVTPTNAPGQPAGDSSTLLTAAAPAAGTPPAAAAKPDAAVDAKPDDKPADKAGESADDAPIDYKFELPKDVAIDEARLADFTAIAKDLKLAPAAAQKMVDLAVAQQQAAIEAHVNQVKTWGNEVAADKVLGKPENQALARKAIEQFGDPQLKTLLNETGFGNHPALVKLMFQVGKALSEDKVIVGRGDAPAAPRDAAAVLYPNQA